jgi:hypothetical protein
MFSSYQKQALTVMISPLCTDCHDITVILLNVALNTINLTYRELLALAGKYIYLNLYTDIYLPLPGKYILKPCSGSKFFLLL